MDLVPLSLKTLRVRVPRLHLTFKSFPIASRHISHHQSKCVFTPVRRPILPQIRWEATARLNSAYQREADKILQHLAEHFEKAKEDGAEWIEAVDFDAGDGVLQVDIVDKVGE
ncbi:MAG: uncharacterized protein KVP18_001919 [Porospora cf. gigantea A]|uniref:uncharacterized protein n=1 Tax=Porospora cf. gigantea A TaxID=2853593 RepID=UPI003559A2AA|nr:MAG: hypothetical protein KVP18_001919 [Porospora cf. gigantea A]